MFLDNSANIVAFVEGDSKNISTTVTKKDPYENISSVAKKLNIPSYCPKDIKEAGLVNFLESFNADVFIVCGFQSLLPDKILKIPPLGAINFHSSLLPRHAGMHPGFFTIWYGDSESGMTIHFMDSNIDTGDIIFQSKVPVFSGDTIAMLYDRIWDSSEVLVKKLLDGVEAACLPSAPQDMSRYFYNYELSERDFELDFRQPAETLYRRIKMLPGKFYYKWNGKKYYVEECSVVKELKDKRQYTLRKPLQFGGKIIFLTPRHYLQIERIKMMPL